MIAGISGSFLSPGQVHGTFGSVRLPVEEAREREKESRPPQDTSAQDAQETETDAQENRRPQDTQDDLAEEERREVEELKTTDRKVRQHEQMHIAAGQGLITSGPSYEFTTGPDGQRYVVGGEVGIDTSKGRTPEETLRRAARIRAAALAPPDPSPQDRSVAAKAGQMQMEAAQEIAQQQMEKAKGASGTEGTTAETEAPEPELPGAKAAANDGKSPADAALGTNETPATTNESGNEPGTAFAHAARAGAYRAMIGVSGVKAGSMISAYA
ncbi:MAG: hypothetical protein LBO00_05505 [Zoogloeaceae bacterium]|jgi:hypothetical protein|nr:hypothetical protein [Zoogloeaceae bacterium]